MTSMFVYGVLLRALGKPSAIPDSVIHDYLGGACDLDPEVGVWMRTYDRYDMPDFPYWLVFFLCDEIFAQVLFTTMLGALRHMRDVKKPGHIEDWYNIYESLASALTNEDLVIPLHRLSTRQLRIAHCGCRAIIRLAVRGRYSSASYISDEVLRFFELLNTEMHTRTG